MKQLLSSVILVLFLGPNLMAQKFIQVSDLKYFEGANATEKHQLDLYLPSPESEAPLLLWIHGGAWAFGDRKNEKGLAEKFAKQGIAVAVVSYRLSPGTWADPKYDKGIQHPEHIKDIARAFAWLYRKADDYGYDKSNIFVSGYSAGGHLSALLAADSQYLEVEGLSTAHIKAIIPIAGAYDISDYHEAHLRGNGPEMAEKHVKAVFGNTETHFANASPTAFINKLNCPIFLISESQTYDYTLVFERALKAAKTKNVEYLHARDMDHRSFYSDLAKTEHSDYRAQIVAFISKWSKKTG